MELAGAVYTGGVSPANRGQTTCGAHTCTQTDTIRTSLAPLAALEQKCMVHITYGQTADVRTSLAEVGDS